MARPHRIQRPGGLFHVMGRGVAGLALFRSADDFRIFLAVTAEVVERQGWICLGYCLLDTHYHLLVRTPAGDLARGMQRLNGHYAAGFNRRHGRTGHVLERRYTSVPVERDGHLLWLFRYLALNPCEAGLAARPAEWPWSSYRALLGLAPAPDSLAVDAALAYFGPDRRRARARLRELVEGGAGDAAAERRA